MSHDFLFELGSEELPSGAVKPLSEALATHLLAGFAKANLSYGEVRIFATPRRLAVFVHDLQTEQAAQQITRRGPACAVSSDAEGRPLPALIGFAKSCGVTIDDLTKLKTDKGEWWVYDSVSAGVHTRDLLPTLVADAIAALPIAKPMRWGSVDVEFARPVHWAVMLFEDKIVSANVLGIKTDAYSFGHRFHHPASFVLKTPSQYESMLREAFVVANFDTRRQLIIEQVQQLAAHHQLEAIMPDALLDEVTSIVEWPQALMVGFDEAFLDVPAEALIAAMQVHQKCFALRDKSQKLAPYFITVANIQSQNPVQVIAGNEKVMRARLSDAAFFYNQDKKNALSHYLQATEQVIFQEKLGSLADKSRRMQALIEHLITPLQLEPEQALRAAELSKCDLLTGMVGEFPELQGLMGYYYAMHDGEANAVAIALNEQYMPRFSADVLPQSNLGLALSLVDRLDILVSAFAIGQRPSGVKDPFKLRRHALAVVRLLISTPATLSLNDLIKQTSTTLSVVMPTIGSVDSNQLKSFILDRLHAFYQSQGIAGDYIHAVCARQDDHLYDMDKRIKALLHFTQLPEASALSAACKRVNNLLQYASAKRDNDVIDISLFTELAESTLFDKIQSVEQAVNDDYAAGNYVNILSQLASLRKPIDMFFDQVLIMVDEQKLKQNRLNLLARLNTLLQGVADISLLPTI